MNGRRHGERGIGLLAIGIWILALAVMMGVAVDIARLAHTASEVQAIADAAALSGARTLFNNRGTPDGTEVTAARTAGNFNWFNGQLFPLADDATGTMTVQTGTFDGTACTVGGGGATANCVRAVPTALNVPFIAGNLVGSFLGNSATGSNVTKEAVAAFGCGTTCQPQLPIILCAGSGELSNLDPSVPCSPGATIGAISQAPSPSDTSCWTCLQTSCGGNTQTYLNLLPPECGGTGSVTASVGQSIEVSQGQNTPVLTAIRDCIKPTANGGHNKHFFLVPVSTSCNSCGGTVPITTFAKVNIGCTDPNCTDETHCDCTGSDGQGRSYNTWNCSNGSPCHTANANDDPTQPAVVDSGNPKGIFQARQVCDGQGNCTGISIASCGGTFGLGLVK